MLRKCLICLVLAACATPSRAYYVAWEGDCLPEDGGWNRNWGDWSGQYHGTGAVRTIQDGVMTMDSLYDDGVCDFAYIERPLNPAPGEMFVLEWRLAVDQVIGPGDPGIGLFSDDGWAVFFEYWQGFVRGGFDSTLQLPISMGEFHNYRMTTWDMRVYQLFVDGQLEHEGTFWYCAASPKLGWGDDVQGAASLHRWDYVRVSTIPEPACLALLPVIVAYVARRRRFL